MQAVSYSEVRKDLKKHLDRVYLDHDPLIISRRNNENVIVLSLKDYNALVETQYLLSSKKNAERIFSSLEKARNNKGFEKKLAKI